MPKGLTRGPCESMQLVNRNGIQVAVKPICPYKSDGTTRVISIQLEGADPFWLNTHRTIWVSIFLHLHLSVIKIISVLAFKLVRNLLRETLGGGLVVSALDSGLRGLGLSHRRVIMLCS